MPCFSPVKAWRLPNGGRLVFGDKEPDYLAKRITIPCGQCVGCRLERSRQWAVRCVLESSLYEDNSFITLTYDDKNLPPGGTLVLKDLQDFLKRLRDRVGYGRFRYYASGEYGDQFRRPHYHALLFNFDFSDKVFERSSARGDKLYTSDFLSEVWGLGRCEIGAVSFNSAAYVARYVVDKVNGDFAERHYQSVDEWGEIHSLLPEFSVMSRRPGIGDAWIRKYFRDVYPRDFVVVNGVRCKPPRFFDLKFFNALTEDFFLDIKDGRADRAFANSEDNSPDRLLVRQEVLVRRLRSLERKVG